jgi:hypothetical protein
MPEAVLKRRDIQPCICCGKGVMHTGLPLCYRVTIERFGFDMRALQRLSGLEQFFGGGSGGATLADVMGPGDDLAKRIGDAGVALVCEACSTGVNWPIAAIAGSISEIDERRQERELEAEARRR